MNASFQRTENLQSSIIKKMPNYFEMKIDLNIFSFIRFPLFRHFLTDKSFLTNVNVLKWYALLTKCHSYFTALSDFLKSILNIIHCFHFDFFSYIHFSCLTSTKYRWKIGLVKVCEETKANGITIPETDVSGNYQHLKSP